MRQRKVEAGDFGTLSVETSKVLKKSSKRKAFSSLNQRNIFWFCLAFRAINALLVQTYFNPDEHWQALEVAHRIAFGYFIFCFHVYEFHFIPVAELSLHLEVDSLFMEVKFDNANENAKCSSLILSLLMLGFN